MQELLKEYFGEIAILIYILYPLLKRAWARLNKKGDTAPKPKKAARKTRSPSQAKPFASPRRRARPLSPSVRPRPTSSRRLAAKSSH